MPLLPPPFFSAPTTAATLPWARQPRLTGSTAPACASSTSLLESRSRARLAAQLAAVCLACTGRFAAAQSGPPLLAQRTAAALLAPCPTSQSITGKQRFLGASENRSRSPGSLVADILAPKQTGRLCQCPPKFGGRQYSRDRRLKPPGQSRTVLPTENRPSSSVSVLGFHPTAWNARYVGHCTQVATPITHIEFSDRRPQGGCQRREFR